MEPCLQDVLQMGARGRPGFLNYLSSGEGGESSFTKYLLSDYKLPLGAGCKEQG